MIDKLTVVNKPDTISWNELARCQQRAHENNIACGIIMKCAGYTAEELRNKACEGITLVAINESGVLAGMLTIIIRNVKRWWHNGKAAEICYVAVDPKFQGRGVYRLLGYEASNILKQQGVKVSYLTTHIKNTSAQKVYEKDGYRKVMLTPGSGLNYYSVVMAKWIEGKRKNRILCKTMFYLSSLAVKLCYKPGKQKRF